MTDPILFKNSSFLSSAGKCLSSVLMPMYQSVIDSRQRQADNYIKHLSSVHYVRRYADQVEKRDPRFASDLRAAADRTEMELETGKV